MSVERGTSDPVPGELTDNTAQHLIRFDDLNPFTYTDRSIIVRNPTSVIYTLLLYEYEYKNFIYIQSK